MLSAKNAESLVLNLLLTAGLLIAAPPSRAERLQTNTVDAFDRYIRAAEAGEAREITKGNNFLWVDSLPQPSRMQAYAQLKQGEVVIRQCPQCSQTESFAVSGGLIHDWTGLVFVPRVSVRETIALLQDYNQDAVYYRPEVLRSKILSHSGDTFHVFLRLKQVQTITVVFDAEYDIHYVFLDATHAYSRSYSTRISEVDDPGEPQERERAAGDDHGFLWRLYTYWRFYEANGGTYVECRAISLTHDIPTGLGWLARPFIENIPGDSLRFTLEATRRALLNKSTDAAAFPVEQPHANAN